MRFLTSSRPSDSAWRRPHEVGSTLVVDLFNRATLDEKIPRLQFTLSAVEGLGMTETCFRQTALTKKNISSGRAKTAVTFADTASPKKIALSIKLGKPPLNENLKLA